MRLSQKTLLGCGVVAGMLYIGLDVVSSMLYQGYSYRDHAVSELSAIGAPTQWIRVASMALIFDPLLIAFGMGVRKLSAQNVWLHRTGTMLVVWGCLGYVWLLFPIHMRETIRSTTDTMHLAVGGVIGVTIMLLMGLGAIARRGWFRIYSVISIAIMAGFGAWAGTQVARMVVELPTPWIGAVERISVYIPMIWIAVLGTILLREKE